MYRLNGPKMDPCGTPQERETDDARTGPEVNFFDHQPLWRVDLKNPPATVTFYQPVFFWPHKR